MTREAAVRIQLPLLRAGKRTPLWWGMVMFLIIDAVVYATLVSAYLYLRFHTPMWPPAGVAPPNPLLGGGGALLLLTSAVPVFVAERRLSRDGDPRSVRPGFAAGGLLAAGFLLVQAADLAVAGFRWDAHAYGSLIWTIAMVHAVHVATLGVAGVSVAVLAGRGYFGAEERIGVEILALFWYFVALVWLPVAAVVYLLPGAR